MSLLEPEENDPAQQGFKWWRRIQLWGALLILALIFVSWIATAH